MQTPTTRVLAVLELLQGSAGISGPDLAQHLQVDERTVRRYIVKLQDLGIPVLAERGRYGLYRLVRGYKLPPMIFSNEEATALALGLLFTQRLGLATTGEALQSAKAKLERVMPEALGEQLRSLNETVVLDLAPAFAAVASATLVYLSGATRQRQRVRLTYHPAEGVPSVREFDCYGLAWRSGRWYALGYCHLRAALRSFRLDRISGVQLQSVNYTVPADFDAISQLAAGVASIPRAHSIKVKLWADLETARAALSAPFGVFEPCADGVLLHGQADDLRWYARMLAGLAFKFEILAPLALQQALQAQLVHLQHCVHQTTGA